MQSGDFRRSPTSPVMLSEAKHPAVLDATWPSLRIVWSRLRRNGAPGLQEASARGAE